MYTDARVDEVAVTLWARSREINRSIMLICGDPANDAFVIRPARPAVRCTLRTAAYTPRDGEPGEDGAARDREVARESTRLATLLPDTRGLMNRDICKSIII